MTNELTGIVACTLLTIAQLAIVASGLALMLRFTAIARRFFLVGLGLVAATGFVVPIISDVTELLRSWGVPLVILVIALLVVRLFPRIARWVSGHAASVKVPDRHFSKRASQPFPGYRDR